MKKILLVLSLFLMALIITACDTDRDQDNEEPIIISSIYINVEGSNEIERNNWQNASLSIMGDEKYEYESDELRVRGRGNSTWYSVPEDFKKRPYRIRFDEDVSILGMKEARDYVLLAELFDRSLLRNYFAHRMSEDLNIEYKLETKPVELYVNNEYYGFYTLTEQIEVHNNKLNIDTSGFDGGFLIELEADERVGDEGIEDINWVRVRDRNYVIKAPDMDKLEINDAREKTTYIKTFLNDVYTSLSSTNYEEYVNIDQFIDYFILNEISKQIDINWSSVYAFRDKDNKLQMGPIWDFDIAFGNANYGEKFGIAFESSEGFWMPGNQWFDRAISNQAFKVRYIARFKEVLNTYFDDWMKDLNKMFTLINEVGDKNFKRWPILDYEMWPVTQTALAANSHLEHFIILRDYLNARKVWILNNIDEFYNN